MQFKVAVLVAISLSSLTSSQPCLPPAKEVKIVCSQVHTVYYVIVGNLLQCVADRSLNATVPDTLVTSVVQSSRSAATNPVDLSQIEALWIEYTRSMKFIPSGIKKNLPNLRALFLKNNGILTVNKENLREFGDSLGNLDLAGNQLTYIDDDLLEYNSNLKDISFYNNPITQIDAGFFDNLRSKKSLGFVNFDFVGCMHQKFEGYLGVDKIDTFIWNNERCNDARARVESKDALIAVINSQQNQKGSNKIACEDKQVDRTATILTIDTEKIIDLNEIDAEQ